MSRVGATRSWIPRIALLAAVGGAVACDADVSNTGYTGTWSRGSDAVRSTLAIVRDGDGYRVRWRLRTADDMRTVDCNWDGVCEEFVGGEKVADFTLTPRLDPASGNLKIECRGQVYKPTAGEMYYLDELTVRTRGKKMIAHTLEESGETWTRGEGQPRRIFSKVSDDVEDPPSARSGA